MNRRFENGNYQNICPCFSAIRDNWFDNLNNDVLLAADGCDRNNNDVITPKSKLTWCTEYFRQFFSDGEMYRIIIIIILSKR